MDGLSCFLPLISEDDEDDDADGSSQDSADEESRKILEDGGLHKFHNPDSETSVHPAKWCITMEDLDFFEAEVRSLWKEGKIPDDTSFPNKFHDDEAVGPSIHQVNKYYIMPETLRQGGMSWALMRNPQGLECDIFATHCWAEGVFEFITKVRRMWPRGARHLWACFLALPQNGGTAALWQPVERRLCPTFDDRPVTFRQLKTQLPQHLLEDMTELQLLQYWQRLERVDLQDGLRVSPFARALRRAKHLLVIPNRTTSIYSRLWCVYEAFLALHLVTKNNLTIKLPCEAPPMKLASALCPGLLMWLMAAASSYWLMAPHVGKYLPPLLWLVIALLVSLLVNQVKACIQVCKPHLGLKEEIFFGWLQLIITGLGFGFVQHGVQDLSWGKADWTWEPGEGWACGFLTMGVVAMHSNGIVELLAAAVTRAEGVQLDFTTVEQANCTDPQDEQRIREAIRGYEQEIDHAISALRTIGHFDRGVMRNMSKGMSAQRAATGTGLFNIFTACSAWSYWWVTDLSAHKHHIFATEALLATFAVALGVKFLVGDDKAIFAMDALFFTGIAFVVTSTVFARFCWNDYPIRHWEMSEATLPMQLFFFLAMFLACLLYYCGGLSSVRGRFCSRWPFKSSVDAMPDDLATRALTRAASEPTWQEFFCPSPTPAAERLELDGFRAFHSISLEDDSSSTTSKLAFGSMRRCSASTESGMDSISEHEEP